MLNITGKLSELFAEAADVFSAMEQAIAEFPDAANVDLVCSLGCNGVIDVLGMLAMHAQNVPHSLREQYKETVQKLMDFLGSNEGKYSGNYLKEIESILLIYPFFPDIKVPVYYQESLKNKGFFQISPEI